MRVIYPIDLIILNNKNQVLLCQRTENEFGFGQTWSIPGGDMEDGESLETTIKREIAEELDCTIKWFKKFRSYDYKLNKNLMARATYLYGQIEGEIKLSDELSNKQWIDLDKSALSKLEFAFNQKQVMNDFVDFFNEC